MKFILVVILTISGGKEIGRTVIKGFPAYDSCAIYQINHPELNKVIDNHPPLVKKAVCEKAK